MTTDEVIEIIHSYKIELKAIHSRFDMSDSMWGYSLKHEDEQRFTGIVTEIRDLLLEAAPRTKQSMTSILSAYNSNFGPSGSITYNQVSAVITAVEALETKINRFPSILERAIGIQPQNLLKSEILDRICEKFHIYVRQLRSRYDDRAPLEIMDEYDVQDSFHALLRIFFEDIRSEESTPGFAGSALRGDFFLPEIDTFLEIKMTRHRMSIKSLGEQLIVDIAKYQSHPGCKRIVCFIYDPEALIPNPAGLKNDLESRNWNVQLTIHICP